MKSPFVSLSSCRALMAAMLCLSVLGLTGCNGIGGKDSLLARIDGESVYQEDYDLLLKNNKRFRVSKSQVLYDELYSKAALASRAVTEFPDLEKEWVEYYKDMDPRILTVMFQRFFASECLMIPESELRKFYEENRSLFESDSASGYAQVRGEVAKRLYVKKNAADFEEYLKANIKDGQPLSAADSSGLRDRFVGQRLQDIRTDLTANIKEKQGYNIHSLPAVDPKEYFEHHKDQFMTVPGYEVYHVQDADSASLESLFATAPSFEQFKMVAATASKNSLTKKDSGLVGFVKENFALPYGIGMVEGLDGEMKGKEPGFVTKSLRGQDGNFHKFYLVAQVPAKYKEYDRAEAGVKAGIDNGEFYDVDSNFVLISKEGKTVLTEAELRAFNDKFAFLDLNVKNHNRLVSMLAETYAFADAAKGYKINRSWEYRATVRMARWDFIGDKYMERKRGAYIVPDDSLKNLYDRVGSPIHVGYTYEKAINDLRLVNGIPLNLYWHEYLMGYRVIYAGKTFDESIPFIYSRRESDYNTLYRQRLASEAYKSATVHLFDMGESEYRPVIDREFLLARADSLVKAGNRSAAYYVYRNAMYAYAEDDSLFEKVAYEMGVIQADNEEFLDAEGEYYAFYRMWPKSVNAEKAMFSRGFMLNENLGMNDKALEVLDEFVKTYPGSELKESAEWLVNNIKSDGKLAEDLMKKISEEE